MFRQIFQESVRQKLRPGPERFQRKFHTSSHKTSASSRIISQMPERTIPPSAMDGRAETAHIHQIIYGILQFL